MASTHEIFHTKHKSLVSVTVIGVQITHLGTGLIKVLTQNLSILINYKLEIKNLNSTVFSPNVSFLLY